MPFFVRATSTVDGWSDRGPCLFGAITYPDDCYYRGGSTNQVIYNTRSDSESATSVRNKIGKV